MGLKNFAKALIITVLTTPVLAAPSDSDNHGSDKKEHSHHDHSDAVDTKEEIKAYVSHHLEDTYHFGIWDKLGIAFPLPVVLIDEGLHVFSSSKFSDGHGHHSGIAESKDKFYKIDHGKIYRTDAQGTITYDEDHHPTNSKPLDFSITKNVMMIIITGFLMIMLFRSLGKSYAANGGISKGIGRFMEPIVLYIRDDIAKPNIGEKRYKKYLPFLLTIFFFIWFLNIFGLTPLGVNVTGNIAITFALALMVFLFTNFTGTKDYWLHLFDPLGNAMPWYGKAVLYIILIPIEILGIFIKPFSLMIRLYANMQAGHIVLMSLIGLIYIFGNIMGGGLSFVLAFAISLIEVLVALLQAYIFTMLAALYFGFAAEEHEHHDEAHAH